MKAHSLQMLMLIALLIGGLTGQDSLAQEVLDGSLGRVIDGDSMIIKLNHEDRWIHLRLAGIDCPEADQPYGAEAKELLTNLTSTDGSPLKVQVLITDEDQRYKRLVGIVFDEFGQNLNLRMLEAGAAWFYFSYQRSIPENLRALFYSAFKNAQDNKLGLFADESPIRPWVHRRNKAKIQP